MPPSIISNGQHGLLLAGLWLFFVGDLSASSYGWMIVVTREGGDGGALHSTPSPPVTSGGLLSAGRPSARLKVMRGPLATRGASSSVYLKGFPTRRTRATAVDATAAQVIKQVGPWRPSTHGRFSDQSGPPGYRGSHRRWRQRSLNMPSEVGLWWVGCQTLHRRRPHGVPVYVSGRCSTKCPVNKSPARLARAWRWAGIPLPRSPVASDSHATPPPPPPPPSPHCPHPIPIDVAPELLGATCRVRVSAERTTRGDEGLTFV